MVSPVLALDLRIVGLDGTVLSGKLVRVAPELTIATADGERALAWNEILEVRAVDVAPSAAGTSRPSQRPPLRFSLADGSNFLGSIVGNQDGDLRVSTGSATSGRVALSNIRSIVSTAPPETAKEDLARWLATPPTDADGVIVAGSAKALALDGAIKDIDATRVLFSFKGQQRELPWKQIAGVFVHKNVARGATTVVRTSDGQRFAGRITGGDDDSVTLSSGVFEQLAIAWSQIERIEVRSDRLQFLSDLKPVEYQFEPLFSSKFEPAFDESLGGGPIVVGGREFAKGICMRSRSFMIFRIGGEYRQFAATVGILDETGGRGNAIVAINGDGRTLWSEKQLRGGEGPREVTIDVSNVDTLVLLVDRGEDLDIADHVAWAFARLIR
ncbi:MAG: NPCBM/NEW2 domain-containing protein [Phycisphaerae bacterium]